MDTAMKRTAFHVLSLLAAVLLAGCADTPQQQYARAKESFAVQDFDSARAELLSSLHETPGNIAMLALLARTQLRLGDPDGALATVAKLRARGANGPGVYRIEAEAKLLGGKTREAIALLGSDATPEAWRIRARIGLLIGKPMVAVSAFEQGIAAGDDVRLLADYVWFNLSANDLSGAEALLQRLRRYAPDAMETLIVSGDMAVRQGRVKQAHAYYRRAASLFPTRFQPHVSEAELFEGNGNLKEAAAAAEWAARLAPPNHPVVRTLRLRIAAKRGKWVEVRAALQSLEDKLDPQSPDSLLYAEALLRLGFGEQARARLGPMLLLQPGNRYVRGLLGEAQLATHDAQGAFNTLVPLALRRLVWPEELALVERAARTAGRPEADIYRARLNSPEYRRLCQSAVAGDAATARGDWPAAARAWRGILAMGEDAAILDAIANATSRAGNHAEAVALAERALALAPGDPAIMKTVAMSKLAAGADRAESARLLRRALLADPGNQELALLLSKAEGAGGP